MDTMKQCPYCAEMVNKKALLCRYCKSTLSYETIDKEGQQTRIRVKTYEKIYSGDLFVPNHLERISDVINDPRYFILLTNAKEETKTNEIDIGFIAINKSIVEWVRLIGYN